ncbi:MAG: SufE family protein [Verrucomicrobiales bacterium]|nr:SufE family protein [Verrucomicrobiales bacterium]
MNDPSFADRHDRLGQVLGEMRDPQERLAWVVDQARRRPAFPAERRTDDRLVKGCAARLWLDAEREAGRCRFACDSDSAILKAAAGLLCDLYDGLSFDEVIHGEPAFLNQAGLLGQLTENRRRTILRVREAIRAFASAAANE